MGIDTTGAGWWAQGADAENTEMSDAFKTRGFKAGEPPSSDHFNLLMAQIIPSYAELYEAANEFPVGGWFRLNDIDLSKAPGETLGGQDTGAAVALIATDGKHIVHAPSSGNVTVRFRNLLGTVQKTLERTDAGTNKRLLIDGSQVVLCYDEFVELWDLASGAPVWIYGHGSTLHDIAWDESFVYAVGVAGGGGSDTLVAIDRAGEGEVGSEWGHAHGATLYSVAADGVAVYASGTANSSNKSLIARSRAAGSAVWSQEIYTAKGNNERIICTDGHLLFMACSDTDLEPQRGLEARSLIDGSLLWQNPLPEDSLGVLYRVVCDDRYVYALFEAKKVVAYDKKSGGRLFVGSITGPNTTTDLATDGAHLWIANDRPSALNTIRKLHIGSRHPRLWRRVAPTERYLGGLRQLVIPQERL